MKIKIMIIALFAAFLALLPGLAQAAASFHVKSSSSSCIWVQNYALSQFNVCPGQSAANVKWAYVGSGYCVFYTINGGSQRSAIGPQWVWMGNLPSDYVNISSLGPGCA